MSRPADGPGRPAESTRVDAWAVARALSPHPQVRVADIDEHGAIANSYSSTVPTSGRSPAPGRPYALHLVDERRRYRLLGFDLDVHKGPVTADLDRLRELLTRARLPHVVCRSGPTGGRHVWVALAQPVTAAVVAGIAHGLRAMLPSLDSTPLLNPRTGALRPPLAPHRLGGRAEVLHGRLEDLLHPVATPTHVLALAALVQTAQSVVEPPVETLATARDADGHQHLTGPRRGLSARARAALHDPMPPATDASAVLRTALCGAVRARWHLADILALLLTAPGLIHARTQRAGGHRDLRATAEQTAILTRQWHRAVEFIAANPRAADIVGDDETFEPRCSEVVAAVAALQRRADAAPGRWAQGGGPADRRVLDVACEQMLTAVRLDIELDVRRLALLTGMGRSTAHAALRRLVGDGWITPAAPAAGVHGAHWALPTAPATPPHRAPDELSTAKTPQGRTQGNPPPSEAPTLRRAWLSHLRGRTSAVLHDALTASGLGHHTARVYQALTTTPTSGVDLTVATGYSSPRLQRLLDRLAGRRLACTDRAGHWRLLGRGHTTGARLDRAARALGVDGLLVDRAARYGIERQAWAWWCDELAWRSLPTLQKKRVPGAGQNALPLPELSVHTRHQRGPHPHTRGGRADFAAARRHLAEAPELARTA